MKQFLLVSAFLFSFSANAFFYCETKAQTEAGNPIYSISVFEATKKRPYTILSLASGDNRNVPQSFSCESVALSNDGTKHTEYQCEGLNTLLSVYVSKEGSTWLANLYSENLQIDEENLNCSVP